MQRTTVRLSKGKVILTALMMTFKATRTTVHVAKAWEVAVGAEEEVVMMVDNHLVEENKRVEASATRIKITNISQNKAIISSKRDKEFGRRTRCPKRAMMAQVISRLRATQLNRGRKTAKAKKSRKRIRRKTQNTTRMQMERHLNLSNLISAWALHMPQHKSLKHSMNTKTPRQAH